MSDAVAGELAAAGVDRVFGLPGGEIVPLIDAAAGAGSSSSSAGTKRTPA